MPIVQSIRAREILDSRGNPTIEVILRTNKAEVTASVPSGASTGKHEALELRDHDKRYGGEGVQKAIKNIEKIIAPKLNGKNCQNQEKIDQILLTIDGTKNKSRLGANGILAVSLACSKASANAKSMPLYKYLSTLTISNRKPSLPRPFFNVINGGKHADNKLSFQEFMIVPNLTSYRENLRAGSEIYHILKKDIYRKYGKNTTNIGDEGGFAPPLKDTEEALKILMKAINDAGYKNKVGLAIDCAASEFYKSNYYYLDGKKLTKEQLLQFYLHLIKKYPLISIEDPFEQEDFESFHKLKTAANIQIVGDDLTVTNIERISTAIKKGSCNCLLLKVNQIGTLTQALNAAQLAFENKWNVMVSHRSGETEDTFIADLAVALGCGMIKAGAPCRGERVAKYNQLLRIEEKLKRTH